MKKLIILYLIALIGIAIPIDSYSQYKAPCFRPGVNANLQGQSTNYIITTDSTISYGSSQMISSLFITGQAVFDNSYDSHVRVVLCDNYNTEYLIYESYPLMADSSVNNFSKTAVETRMLSNVTPQSLKFKVHNAHIDIDSIYTAGPVTLNNGHMMAMAANKVEQDSMIVERLNQKLEAGNKTWRARCTSVSELTYDEKKDLFGGNVPALYGFEYYSYGVFVMPDYEQQIVQGQAPTPSNSPYVEEWDWRNRHGKNWMTPVKNQRTCGSCWAFSAIGTLESYINLYYNQLLNYDLSEQELVSCSTTNGCGGGWPSSAFNYIKNNGIVVEDCFPYTATNNLCSNKCDNPTDKLFLSSHRQLYRDEDTYKDSLFVSPKAFSISIWDHAIVLAGFKKINAGERFVNENGKFFYIDSLNPLVNHTAWLVKNSWGDSWGRDGYYYVALNINITTANSINGRIYSDILDDDDVVCEDADGDGYFNWGIGPRPSTCPSWAPLERDGDDSDYAKGPLTQYGFLTDINPDLNDTIFIDENTLFNERMYSHKHIVVRNNSSLTLSNLLTCYDGVKIIVEDGSSLIVDGGTVENVILLPHVGSTITLKNDGHIMHNGTTPFYLPRGALLFNIFGKIE